MDKAEVAAILDEIGTLLELQGENSFRCNAYHNGARAIEQLTTNLTDVVNAGKLSEVPGIGSTLQEKITTLVQTGALPFYDDLKKKIPAGVVEMLRIPGVGPKKVKAMWETLHVDTLEKLKTACETDQVAKLKGFGAKTQQKILEGLAFVGQTEDRVRIDQALPMALKLMEGLKDLPGVEKIELGGSLRRRKETIKDIDILIASDDAEPIMDRFVTLPGVVNIVGRGPTKASVMVAAGAGTGKVTMNADLRVVSPAQFPYALHYFTGNKDHNIAMRSRAIAQGLKLNEYELAGAKKKVVCKSEEDVFKALGLDWIPPEMREHTGEVEAAEKHEVPNLVEVKDIQGVFHCHTTWSDGNASLEEMAAAAQAEGLHYLGIGDHSQSLNIANGLTPERVKKQQKEIDKLNEGFKNFRLFKGTEVDILQDGTLDFPDEVLATFDYVVASVHMWTNQTQEEMTARIIRALSNPYVTMLGHATGRLLLRRDSYKVDLDAVLQAAAKYKKLIEINAHPQRLDIDWVHCKRAKELGVKLVINPDAHATTEIGLFRYGVDVARRGWLEKKDVFNTQTLTQVRKALGK